MLLERTKELVLSSPFTEKFKSGTITRGELEELYGMYGKIYFRGSDKQKLDFWAKPLNDCFTKTDAIIDFVLYMGPSMSDGILRSINRLLIAIEQEYATTNKLVFMRQASVAKYFLAYEAFRLKDQDVCAFYFPAKESSPCKDEKIQPSDYAAVKCRIDLAKIYLLIHVVEEKVAKLTNPSQLDRASKQLRTYKTMIKNAVESNNEDNQALTYDTLFKYSLKLDSKIAKQELQNYLPKKQPKKIRDRPKSAPVIRDDEADSARDKELERCSPGLPGPFSLFSSFHEHLTGRYGKLNSGTRSSSSQSGISSSLSSLSSPGFPPDEEEIGPEKDVDGLPVIVASRRPGQRS